MHLSVTFSFLFLSAALLLFLAGRYIPGFADSYRAAMNPVILDSIGRFFGLFPFSVAEMLLCAAIPLLILFARRRIFFRALFFLLSLGALLFELNEGVYFSCTTFTRQYRLDRGSYSTEELAEVCRALAERANACAPSVSRDGEGIMQTDPGLPDRMRGAVQDLGSRYDVLDLHLPRPKGVLFSRLLSDSSLTGIYSIFTVEANYNREMAPYNTPFTMAHELSHLCGVMSEKEANFVGYLACRDSAAPDIRYSGALMGWIYCGNELYRRNYDKWLEIASTLDESVNRDLEYNTEFWDRHRGKTSETVQKLNDSYLKAGGIAEGAESYDLVVDLIVAYERDQSG